MDLITPVAFIYSMQHLHIKNSVTAESLTTYALKLMGVTENPRRRANDPGVLNKQLCVPFLTIVASSVNCIFMYHAF